MAVSKWIIVLYKVPHHLQLLIKIQIVSSGLCFYIILYLGSNVSEEHAASICGIEVSSEDALCCKHDARKVITGIHVRGRGYVP